MPFVFDATITLWRRLWQRKVLWQPHREHHYQQAVLAGVAVKRTLAIAYALMLFSASVASTYHSSNDSIRIICLAAMVVVYGGLIAVTRRYRGSAPADAAAPRSVRANS
jgi:general stress protein CsbA